MPFVRGDHRRQRLLSSGNLERDAQAVESGDDIGQDRPRPFPVAVSRPQLGQVAMAREQPPFQSGAAVAPGKRTARLRKPGRALRKWRPPLHLRPVPPAVEPPGESAADDQNEHHSQDDRRQVHIHPPELTLARQDRIQTVAPAGGYTSPHPFTPEFAACDPSLDGAENVRQVVDKWVDTGLPRSDNGPVSHRIVRADRDWTLRRASRGGANAGFYRRSGQPPG
jgi:hypothetical protein